MSTQKLRYAFVLVLLLITVLLASAVGSCAPVSSKPVVSIGSPPHGAQVNVGQEVLVQVSAADVNGVSRIELWVDGQLQSTAQSPAPQTAQAVVLHWTPTTAGSHLLVVQAVNARSISSEPAAVTVNAVGGGSPAPGPATPPIAATVAACTNGSVFVDHVTVPDGTNWMSGQAFNKIWRVRNTGTCTWGPEYELVFVGGEAMTTQSTFIVPVTASGSTADLLVALIAPAAPGTHSSQWRLRNSNSGLFGATMSVSINVLGSAQPQPPQPPPQPPAAGCPGAPVIASIDASPATITAGQSTTLSWGKVDNATSAVIDQGIGGVATPGNVSVKPDKTTTYTLTATGCGGTVTKQVTITVNPGNIGIIDTSKPLIPLKPDLAVTKIAPVSTTRPDKVYVDIKNTGILDIDANVHVVCVAVGLMRGNPSIVVPASSDETVHIQLSKGGTGFFYPSTIIDAVSYQYAQVTCNVALDGDPTPDDNKMTISIP